MWASYLRWRHSKGFGVHSPFAFGIVENVINLPEKYGLYAYKGVSRSLNQKKNRHLRKEKNKIFFLLRLLSYLKIQKILYCDTPQAFLKIVSENTGIRLIDIAGDRDFNISEDCLLIFSDPDIEEGILNRFIERNGSMLFLFDDNDLSAKLGSEMSRGVIFRDKDMILAIPHQDMAFVKYDITLY